MGCTSSRNLPNEQGHLLKHKEVSRTPDSVHGKSKTPVIGVGRPVGGSSPQLDKRSAQLAAAEQRATKEASRGLNSGAKGVDLNESQKKQELIGKIQAAYQVSNKEVPIGLNLASLDQLKNHLDSVRRIS